MRNLILLAAASLAASVASARADFLVSTISLDPSTPASEPAVAQLAAPHTSAEVEPAPVPRFATAVGFGDDVPLAFAVRQIVPHAVKVTYGPGVGRNEPVSWRGGQPWNRALAAAVRAAGLHLVMTYMAVKIEH